jgi:ubiquinone/menaquinone biosynthesis C-methylase UbiE
MKNRLFCNEVDRMSDFTFRMMEILFHFFYFFKPAKKYLGKFGIKPGFTVVDYGCGPGACIRAAVSLAGEDGFVYAVDLHPLAIAAVEKLIKKHDLRNVKPVLSDGKSSGIKDGTADLIYALDMFHMVTDTVQFLKELNRISKPDCTLILEDGHQPRMVSRKKVEASGYWTITSENRRFMSCKPVAAEK